MGGPSQSTINTQNALTQEQIGIQQQSLAGSQQDRAARVAAQQPAIDQYSALSSGDSSAIMKALVPQLTGVTQGTAAAKEGIYESVGPGAARDVALAQNQVNQGNQTAALRANAVSSSYDKLANIGAGLGSFSLQELGAGISSGQAASSSNQSIMQAQEQSKASTLGFLGELAGAGASLGGAALKGCWIAEAIYGKDDFRTHAVRAWLNGPFRRTWYGDLVMRFYLRFGQGIADFLNLNPEIKPLFRPLFNVALRRALRDMEMVVNA